MKRRNGFAKALDWICQQLHEAYENLDYDFESNGEKLLLRKLADARVSLPVIFDVGANQGDWSLLAASLFPAASVHAFEIVPETHSRLVDRCAGCSRVTCHELGLSNSTGVVDVFMSIDNSQLSTCLPGFVEQYHAQRPKTVRARVSTGDEFCAEHGIESVDLLKIDVEGLEDRVLAGFSGMLKNGRIRMIQFEYGRCNIDTHFLLKDFHQLLEGSGMRVGKVYPAYVDFRAYRHHHEDFLGPNFIAVRTEEEGILQAIGRNPA